MGEKNIKSRNDIDPKYKWKIELMYPDRKSWEEDVDAAMKMTESFLSYQGRLGESSGTLLAALKDLDAINMKFEKAYCYAKMKQDEDNRLGSSQEMLGIITARAAEAGASTSFFSPELLSLSEDKLSGFLDENPELKAYDFVIKDALRMKEHVLSEKEESILARLSEVTGASDNIQSMLSDADLKFGKVRDSDGKKVELSHGNYINFMESTDRKVRKHAFTKMYEAYKNHINTFAAVYGTSVKADVTGAVIRGYDSARHAAMSSGMGAVKFNSSPVMGWRRDSFQEWRAGRPISVLSSSPYRKSPRRGWPRWARWTRIWWVRPVSSSSSTRARSPRFSRTRQRVRAALPSGRTICSTREPGFGPSGASMTPSAGSGTPRHTAR